LYVCGQFAALKGRYAINYAAAVINYRGESVVGCPQQRFGIFSSAHLRHLQMLW